MIRVLLIAGLAASLYAQAPNAAPSGNAQKGKQLFQSYGCYQCHGREAQGEAGTGPRLAPKPIPFAALAKYVRQPTGQMPPYTKRVVSDADLADIFAFLSAQPAPPPAKSIPLLNN
jgi:ubiquinol-cytochrome c reductase cytochrome c subunit